MDSLGLRGGLDEGQGGFVDWDWGTWLHQLLQMAQVASMASCLGKMLYVLQQCSLCNMLGNNMALRGPPGSVDRAVQHMAIVLRNCTMRFVTGLQAFIWSFVFYALQRYHPPAGVTVAVIILLHRSEMLTGILTLTDVFHVAPEEIQRAGTFRNASDEMRNARRRARRSGEDGMHRSLPHRILTRLWSQEHQVLFPTGAKLADELVHPLCEGESRRRSLANMRAQRRGMPALSRRGVCVPSLPPHVCGRRPAGRTPKRTASRFEGNGDELRLRSANQCAHVHR